MFLISCSPAKIPTVVGEQSTSVLPVEESATVVGESKPTAVSSTFPSQTIPSVVTVAPPGAMIKIPMIAINDNGVSGLKIGCDDSVIMVDKPFIGRDALVQAYEELLAVRTYNYGESGLVDPLYQSTLTIKRIFLEDGIAHVYLEGAFMMGGVCDIPRVQAQLEQTALQFPEVKSVQVFVNDKTLAEALSLK